MRRALFLFVAMSIAHMADAQIGGVVVTPVPPVAVLPSHSYSTSAIDHKWKRAGIGHDLFIPPPTSGPVILQPATVKTRVTVVTGNEGTTPKSFEYDGALQVLGVGWHAIYAILNTHTTSTTPTATPDGATIVRPIFSVNRRLVALGAVAGTLPSTLPSIDVPTRAEVKLSASATNTAPETLAFLDAASNPLILTPGAAAPIALRFAQIITYAPETGFKAGKQIPLP